MREAAAGTVASSPAESRAPAVEFLAVDRGFGDRLVLDNVSLQVSEGEIFGVVGPSGSGKTTLVRLIVGLLAPSSGDVTVYGAIPSRFGIRERRRIGYMPQGFSLYPTLTTNENARFVASLYGMGWLARGKRIREVLEFLELWDARGRLAQHLSGGMQRRLSLAGAILHRPSLVVIDEPTAGLDPALRGRIWDYLRELREQGATMIMTTQFIEEAERCDGVAILSEGKVAAAGSPSELRKAAGLPDVIELQVSGRALPAAMEAVRSLPAVLRLEWDGAKTLVLHVTSLAGALPRVQDALSEHSCPGDLLNSRQASFEEVFMHHTGQR